MRNARLIAMGLIAALLSGCHGPMGAASSPHLRQMERRVMGLSTKDEVKVSFSTIVLWRMDESAAGGEPLEPARVEMVFMESLSNDLPRAVAEHEFERLTTMGGEESAVAKLEARMLEQMQRRTAGLGGVRVEKFVVRRLDLDETVQREGVNELQTRQMQHIWRPPAGGGTPLSR